VGSARARAHAGALIGTPPTLFLTGAAGFVGARVLAQAGPGRFARVVALSRARRAAPASAEWVTGDLAGPAGWAAALPPEAVVVHLAAAMGAAGEREQQRVNVEGTRNLLRLCRERGARRFVYVSSIAASFPPNRDYPYAGAKREAERLVRDAGLPCVIVRPTLVIGRGAPLVARLRSLAAAPIGLLPGGGRARVQPVYVQDLADALLDLAAAASLEGTTVEFGGPEVVTMAELLRRLRRLARGSTGPFLTLPMGPLVAAARIATALLGERSPVRAGQLASFVTDAVASPTAFWESRRAQLIGLDAMLREAVDGGCG
jgi:NADH dehydrogenase